MRAEGLTGQESIKVDLIALIVKINMDAVAIERFQLIDISAKLAVTHRVMQLKFSAQRGQLRHLRDERRDADTTRNHQMFFGALIEREQIDRIADFHRHTGLDLLMQVERTATPRIIATHRNRIAGGVLRHAHQGVGIKPAGAVIIHLDHDMRTTRKRRHRLTITADETEPLDQRINRDHLGDGDGNSRGFNAHWNRSTASGTWPGSSASILTPWKAASLRE